MTRGDSLALDSPGAERSLPDSATPSRDPVQGDGSVLRIDGQSYRVGNTDGASLGVEQAVAGVDAALERLYGPEGAAGAREALRQAVAAEGPAAYERFRTSPGAFGDVQGSPAEADLLGQQMRELDVYRAYLVETEHLVPTEAPAPAGDERTPPAARDDLSGDPDPERVRTARDNIRWSLRERGLDRVTHDDLVVADNEIWALTQDDATAVFAGLSEADLQQWAEELNDSGALGPFRGYSSAEQSDLFARFAVKLDGEQLVRFARALGTNGPTAPDDEGQRFGAAVAAHAPPDVRAEVVRRALPEVLHHGLENEPARDLAHAVVEIIGGLRGYGERLHDAIADIAGQERTPVAGEERAETSIGRLLAAGVLTRQSTERDVLSQQTVETIDAGPAARMLQALATVTDPALRARVFMDASPVVAQVRQADQPSGQRLDGAPRGQAARRLDDAMTALLDTRTNETVQSLLIQGDADGRMLTAYIEAQIQSGGVQTIADQIERLRKGDALSEDPTAWFQADVENVRGHTSQENAARLGYYDGSVTAAFRNLADRERESLSELAELLDLVVPSAAVYTFDRVARAIVVDGEVLTMEQALARLTGSAIPLVPGPPDRAGRPTVNELSDTSVGLYQARHLWVTDHRGP